MLVLTVVGLLVELVVLLELALELVALRSLPVILQAGVRHWSTTLLASTRSQLMEITVKPGPISLRVASSVLSVLLFTFHSGLAPAASEQRTLGVMVSESHERKSLQ